MSQELDISFFARKAADVARDLVGRTLVRPRGQGYTRVVITEVAAHEGGSPIAARRGMTYAPGRIFVMPHRGRVFLNIATDHEGMASCVFMRSGIVVGERREVVDGPIKLANRLAITRALDGQPLGSTLWVEGDSVNSALIEESIPDVSAANCTGIFKLRV